MMAILVDAPNSSHSIDGIYGDTYKSWDAEKRTKAEAESGD